MFIKLTLDFVIFSDCSASIVKQSQKRTKEVQSSDNFRLFGSKETKGFEKETQKA